MKVELKLQKVNNHNSEKGEGGGLKYSSKFGHHLWMTPNLKDSLCAYTCHVK